MEYIDPTKTEHTNIKEKVYLDDFLIQVASVFMFVMGGTLLLISAAYIKDLETLRTVPDLLWNAVCGRPSESGIVLPLLLTLTTLSFMTGFGLLVWQRVKHHHIKAR